MAEDQKRIWTFRARFAHGKDLIPVEAILGTAAALVLLDPHEGSYFRNTQTFQPFNKVVTSNTATIGILATPAAM